MCAGGGARIFRLKWVQEEVGVDAFGSSTAAPGTSTVGASNTNAEQNLEQDGAGLSRSGIQLNL